MARWGRECCGRYSDGVDIRFAEFGLAVRLPVAGPDSESKRQAAKHDSLFLTGSIRSDTVPHVYQLQSTDVFDQWLHRRVLLLLLCGGDKSTQARDIAKARQVLRDLGKE